MKPDRWSTVMMYVYALAWCECSIECESCKSDRIISLLIGLQPRPTPGSALGVVNPPL